MKTLVVIIVIFMAQNATAALDESDTIVFNEGRSVITKDLKDPDSAKFRNEYIIRNPSNKTWLCGEINAKNGYGAYTGYTRYIVGKVKQKIVSFLESNGEDEVMDSMCDKTNDAFEVTEIEKSPATQEGEQ